MKRFWKTNVYDTPTIKRDIRNYFIAVNIIPVNRQIRQNLGVFRVIHAFVTIKEFKKKIIRLRKRYRSLPTKYLE